MSIRSEVMDQLKPLLPKTWKSYHYQANLDVLAAPTVVLKLATMVRTPQAPQGFYTVSVVLTLWDPAQDPEKAEDNLEENLDLLLNALGELPGLLFKEAQKVISSNDQHLGFDLTLEILSTI